MAKVRTEKMTDAKAPPSVSCDRAPVAVEEPVALDPLRGLDGDPTDLRVRVFARHALQALDACRVGAPSERAHRLRPREGVRIAGRRRPRRSADAAGSADDPAERLPRAPAALEPLVPQRLVEADAEDVQRSTSARYRYSRSLMWRAFDCPEKSSA